MKRMSCQIGRSIRSESGGADPRTAGLQLHTCMHIFTERGPGHVQRGREGQRRTRYVCFACIHLIGSFSSRVESTHIWGRRPHVSPPAGTGGQQQPQKADTKKRIYLFHEGRKEDKAILGGKGANLCEVGRGRVCGIGERCFVIAVFRSNEGTHANC